MQPHAVRFPSHLEFKQFTAFLPQRFPPLARQFVAALVFGMAGVAAHPLPRDVTFTHQFVQGAPLVLVEHRLAVGLAPAFAFPSGDPLGNAELQVLAVGGDDHIGARGRVLQGLDGGRHLHNIVGRAGGSAQQLSALAVTLDNGAPASGAGVGGTGAIAPDADRGSCGHGDSREWTKWGRSWVYRAWASMSQRGSQRVSGKAGELCLVMLLSNPRTVR